LNLKFAFQSIKHQNQKNQFCFINNNQAEPSFFVGSIPALYMRVGAYEKCIEPKKSFYFNFWTCFGRGVLASSFLSQG
jgi:hypothetical protein